MNTHWTRGRIITLGVIVVALLGILLWGAANADVATVPGVRVTGFPAGSRVMAGVDYGFSVNITPASVGTFDRYDLLVYGGSDSDLNTSAVADGPDSFQYVNNAHTICTQGQAIKELDSKYVMANMTGLGGDPQTIKLDYSFGSVGAGHIFAYLVGYNLADGSFEAPADICNDTTVKIQSVAHKIAVEKNWNCDKGICLVDVDPQVMPAGADTAKYKVYISGLNQEWEYAYISGRYEKNIGATTTIDQCKAVLNPVTGQGAQKAHDLIIVKPSVSGSAFVTPEYSIRFNAGAANRRIVAYLMQFAPGVTPSNYCDKLVSAAGWAYDGTGQGLGGTSQPTPKTEPGTVDTSGGFIANGLTDESIGGKSGFFLSGVCQPNAKLDIVLSKNQGTVSFSDAGLLGICTPNIGGQILKLLMILAAFFFTVTVIISGIAMTRATDSAALDTAKKNLIASATGAFLIVFANWLVPAFISLISNLFS